MRNTRDKIIYFTSILLFSVSFAYFILSALLYLLKVVGNILPFGFFNDGFGAFLDNLFFEEISMGPILLCFGLTVILSVLILAGFWGRFRLFPLIFTAAAPLVLLVIIRWGGVGVVALTEHFFPACSAQIVLAAFMLTLLTAYTIGFFIVMHRKRKYLQAKTENP